MGEGHVAKGGGQYDSVGKVVSHFPHLTLVFVQTVQTVSPRPPCSPLLSVLALFFPFVFNSAGHLPLTQARCTPCGTQASIQPPLARMQAALSPLLSPQPPPPQCLYDWHHFPDPVALQPRLCHTDRGAKGVLAPTISARPPFAHPPPLCSSFHFRGCPRFAPPFSRPPLSPSAP